MMGGRGVGPPHPTGGLALCVGLASVCKKKEECVEQNQRSGQMKVLSSQKMNFPTERSGIEDSVSFSSSAFQQRAE